MIILAWLAVIIPAIIILLCIIAMMTDGFTDWMPLAVVAIMVAIVLSIAWGVKYIYSYNNTNKPVQAERQ